MLQRFLQGHIRYVVTKQSMINYFSSKLRGLVMLAGHRGHNRKYFVDAFASSFWYIINYGFTGNLNECFIRLPVPNCAPPTQPVVKYPKEHFLPSSPKHSTLNYWFPVWSRCTGTNQLMSAGSRPVVSLVLHVLTDARYICCLITGSAQWDCPALTVDWSVAFC